MAEQLFFSSLSQKRHGNDLRWASPLFGLSRPLGLGKVSPLQGGDSGVLNTTESAAYTGHVVRARGIGCVHISFKTDVL